MIQHSHSWAYIWRKSVSKDTCTTVFITALFTIARTWKQPKCPLTEERIKKMWYIYTMEYYPAIIRNKIDCAICRDVDGPRDCHTEQSKSETEKQTSYNAAYMWNLEKWYRWTYLQSWKRDTEVENKCMDAKKESWWGEFGDWHWHIYIILC